MASAAAARDSANPVVTVAVHGIGSVVIEPGHITCNSTCTTTVSPGTEVTLTATPANGFVLAAWHDACAGVEEDTCVIHPDSDATATVVFAIASVTTTEATTTTSTTTTTTPTTTATTTTTPTTTATTTTTPTTTSTADTSQAVAEAVDKLPVATVAFNTPKNLHRNETKTIKLLLSPGRNISIIQLEQRVDEAGEKSGATNVRYSNLMQAELTSNDFEISPGQDDQPLPVVAGQDTVWYWDITPKRKGHLLLHLTLFAFVDVAGQSAPYRAHTFDRTLAIDVGWPTVLADFVKGNWQWLWTAILVPVGFWVVRRRTKPSPGQGQPPSPNQPAGHKASGQQHDKDPQDSEGEPPAPLDGQ